LLEATAATVVMPLSELLGMVETAVTLLASAGSTR
jgi:hypothetical protein